MTLTWATAADCDDCTQSPKISTGAMSWAGPEDLHSAAQTFPTFWNGTGVEDNVVCPTSWTGRTETPDASCDEYAFATTKESGGTADSGVTSGHQCAQFYTTPIDSSTWTLRDDDRYPLPTWSEKCGRASIPLAQNTGALAPFGRTGGFVWYKRMLADDPFTVATPGFDHCTAADTACATTSNAS